jgi:hypothetical protein
VRTADHRLASRAGDVGYIGAIRDQIEPAASPVKSAIPPKKRKCIGADPDAAIGVSYRDATGMTLMTEIVGPVAKPVSRPRSRKPATVSASALAQHLDCSRTYTGKLEADGVILRQGDGFPLDQSRVAYLRYLRRERHTPRLQRRRACANG